jgi:hypothetical protein
MIKLSEEQAAKAKVFLPAFDTAWQMMNDLAFMLYDQRTPEPDEGCTDAEYEAWEDQENEVSVLGEELAYVEGALQNVSIKLSEIQGKFEVDPPLHVRKKAVHEKAVDEAVEPESGAAV